MFFVFGSFCQDSKTVPTESLGAFVLGIFSLFQPSSSKILRQADNTRSGDLGVSVLLQGLQRRYPNTVFVFLRPVEGCLQLYLIAGELLVLSMPWILRFGLLSDIARAI